MAIYLITGGAGFIGSHLVDEVLRRGDQVQVLDNFSTGRRQNLHAICQMSNLHAKRPVLEVIEGDIRDLTTVRQAMEGVDYVLHHAAIISVPQSMNDPITTHTVNVDGTLNVLIAARQFNLKRVVLAVCRRDASWVNLMVHSKHEPKIQNTRLRSYVESNDQVA